MHAECFFHELEFKTPSGTSRGILKTKPSWFLKLNSSNGKFALGECSIIKGLSPDKISQLPDKLNELCNFINNSKELPDKFFSGFPALNFAYEMACLDYKQGSKHELFPITRLREKGIKINGLIWMGTKDFMRNQIIEKIEAGFDCIKIKIAAIDFDEELELLKFIRSEFRKEDIEIRVDANGGFAIEHALSNLQKLAEYDLHSIEQPIQSNNWPEMANLCSSSPLSIALDEDNPQYIILKPSLLGGFAASQQWIELANERNIAWWVTSALESNIGLNAIAQWTGSLNNPMYQGLGTGQLFTNNIESPLQIKNGRLFYADQAWDYSKFNL